MGLHRRTPTTVSAAAAIGRGPMTDHAVSVSRLVVESSEHRREYVRDDVDISPAGFLGDVVTKSRSSFLDGRTRRDRSCKDFDPIGGQRLLDATPVMDARE